MYALLMMQQFPDHDYYFLDTFFPVIIIFLVLITASVYNKIINNTFKLILSFSLCLLLFLSYSDFKTVFDQRYMKNQWNKMEMNDRIYFKGSDVFLDSIGISRDALMLVVNANTTNMPFILMKRKGYAQFHTHPDSIRKAFEKSVRYAILKNDEMYNEVLLADTSLIKNLEKISENGYISIYKITPNETSELKNFIGFSEKDIFKKITSSIETNLNADKIKSVIDTSTLYFSKPYGGHEINYFGLTVELTADDFPKNDSGLQLIYSEVELFGTEDNQQIEFILQVTDATGQSMYFKTFPLKNFIKKNEWNKASLVFSVPPMRDGKKARLFLLNTDMKPYYYDDFNLYIKK